MGYAQHISLEQVRNHEFPPTAFNSTEIDAYQMVVPLEW